MTVKINKDTFNLISQFSSIQPAVIFEKKDDDIIVNRANSSTTIVYRLKLPKSHFTFKGDEISFANFPEFYGLYCALTEPTVEEKTERNHEILVLKDSKSTIKYLLSDSEALTRGPDNLKWSKSDASIKLSSADLKQLRRMIGTLQADTIRFTAKKDTDITMSITKGPNDNSYEESFAAENVIDSDLNIAIEAEFLLLLPDADYLLEMNKDGIIRASFETASGITAELFTGEVEEG